MILFQCLLPWQTFQGSFSSLLLCYLSALQEAVLNKVNICIALCDVNLSKTIMLILHVLSLSMHGGCGALGCKFHTSRGLKIEPLGINKQREQFGINLW